VGSFARACHNAFVADRRPVGDDIAMNVLDAPVMIDHLRGTPDAVAAVYRAGRQGRLLGSVVSRAEVLRGAHHAELPRVGSLFDVIDWVDVDVDVADVAGALAARYRRSHSGIDVPDHLVAATTIVLGAQLWTSNVRHFPMFDGLTPPY